MTSPVAVVTDSAASLPPTMAQAWGISVVPLQVIVDGRAHDEDAATLSHGVLDDLLARQDVSTSQPSPEVFVRVFQAAAAGGAEHVVAVLISGAVSGTVNAAQAAASRVDVPVTVVDSRTLAMATGFAAVAAAAVAREGATAEAVAAEAARVAAGSLCVFTVDTLDYLLKGGRITPTVAAVGRVLSVRPVLGIVDGEVALLERVRTTPRARAAVLARVGERVATMDRAAVAVLALGDEPYGDDAAAELSSRHPDLVQMVRTPVSAVLAAHAGPGVLAGVVADLPAEALAAPGS